LLVFGSVSLFGDKSVDVALKAVNSTHPQLSWKLYWKKIALGVVLVFGSAFIWQY
jgi:hypothetical protein